MHVPDPKSQISTTDLCTNGLAHEYPPTMIEVSIARKPGNARMVSRAPSRTVCRVCGKPWTEPTQVVTLASDTARWTEARTKLAQMGPIPAEASTLLMAETLELDSTDDEADES
jgi:hypothetical protein